VPKDTLNTPSPNGKAKVSIKPSKGQLQVHDPNLQVAQTLGNLKIPLQQSQSRKLNPIPSLYNKNGQAYVTKGINRKNKE